jgi:regulator of sirC expression with transglutaminase-like and TPR domain
MVFRMLSNLKAVYFKNQDYARALLVIERLRQIAPQDLEQERDLGISLLHTGQAGRAIQYLSTYLNGVPQGADNDSVQEILQQALKEVGRWN